MKRITTIILFLALCLIQAGAENRGIPFIRNFSAAEYGAHNRNYDIACDENGTVFVANFEGLLYYDGSSWRKIHTPAISRVTRLALGQHGRVWVGGHKIFGYLEPDDAGRLQLHTIISDVNNPSFDEVDMIKVTPHRIYVHTSDGKAFYVKQSRQLVPLRSISSEKLLQQSADSIYNIKMDGFNIAMAKEGGIMISDKSRRRVITDLDGLCSNNINFMTYDNSYALWGATEHGVFAMELPSPFSHVTESQGLHGDVYALNMIGNTLYIGSLQGLYTLRNGKLAKENGFTTACWQLVKDGAGRLLAATTSGLWMISPQGNRRITETSTLSVVKNGAGGYITGELDGIYKVQGNGQRTLLAKIEKVTSMAIIEGSLRAETIFGEVWLVNLKEVDSKKCVRNQEDVMEPKIAYTDSKGRKWITDFEGRDISLVSKVNNAAQIGRWMKPLGEMSLNAIYCTDNNSLWIGGDFGVINCDLNMVMQTRQPNKREPLYIRQITTQGDSVLWGGFSKKDMMPVKEVKEIELEPSMRAITIYFSTRKTSLFSPNKYRYRINKRQWSKWSEDTYAHFNNLSPGTTTFEVQAMNVLGDVSETAKVSIYLEYPYYMRWWAWLIYTILALLAIQAFTIYREKKLLRAKEELEAVVTKRTAELRQRQSELSTALDDLQRTQADLVRMERTATAGKLTQGLIDRILNPINYINNFAKLTRGLAKDLQEDIEDEKDNMSEDNYEDCEDILDMMSQNLEKIEDHGVNTTRTLRAMEAMMKNHIGTKRETDMAALLKQAVEVTREYHKENIAKYNISLNTEVQEGSMMHEVDPDSIHNVLLALLTNAIYAVVKKYQYGEYYAAVWAKLARIDNKHIEIRITDNGIGIEDTIIDKVFDPFFTTKPTGEASGVGLYLARETIQDHNGTITIKSEKDNFTELVITL